DRGRISRVDFERIARLLAAWGPYRNRHFLRRSIHVHDPLLVRETEASTTGTRLGLRGREKICALECETAGADADRGRSGPAGLNAVWLLPPAAAAVCRQRSVARAKKQPGRRSASGDYGQNADAVGTGAGDRSCARRAGASR